MSSMCYPPFRTSQFDRSLQLESDLAHGPSLYQPQAITSIRSFTKPLLLLVPPSKNLASRIFLAFICYDAATRTGQTSPSSPRYRRCPLLWFCVGLRGLSGDWGQFLNRGALVLTVHCVETWCRARITSIAR